MSQTREETLESLYWIEGPFPCDKTPNSIIYKIINIMPNSLITEMTDEFLEHIKTLRDNELKNRTVLLVKLTRISNKYVDKLIRGILNMGKIFVDCRDDTTMYQSKEYITFYKKFEDFYYNRKEAETRAPNETINEDGFVDSPEINRMRKKLNSLENKFIGFGYDKTSKIVAELCEL